MEAWKEERKRQKREKNRIRVGRRKGSELSGYRKKEWNRRGRGWKKKGGKEEHKEKM